MPPRKNAEKADAKPATEPERRSTRIKDAPPKAVAAVAAPVAKAVKKVKKTDPEQSEYRPTKKPAPKKRKKADVEGDGPDAEEGTQPKKKTKTESKAAATKEKKADEAKADATTQQARTERRKSGVVTVQPTIEEGSETKADEADAQVGAARLPQMKLKNEKGEEIEVSTLAAENGVVIFAAPKADTPGCNRQSCHFRDSSAAFEKHGYKVYALTADSPAALTKWQTKNNLGYSLISDPNRELIGALGAKSGNTTKRSHFVFEKGTGKLIDSKIGVKPDSSAALSFIESL